MTQQWIRAISLVVADNAGKGIDLSNMRIVFQTKQWDGQTPNRLVARIYNLNWDTIAKAKKEFTRVELKAGYGENIATIFTGTIIQARSGRENPTDTFLEIVAADGDVAYNFGVVNISIAAGWTSEDQYVALLKALQAVDPKIQRGHTPTWSSTKHARGLAMSGNAKDYLAELAEREDCTWSIDNGMLNFTPRQGVRPQGKVPVLSARTGLVGMPQQTPDGIMMTCLLNPNIRAGCAVKLDNASGNSSNGVQEAQYSATNAGVNDPQIKFYETLLRTADDGYYKVLVAEHSGDTRGNPWYTSMICVALDGGASTTLVTRGVPQ